MSIFCFDKKKSEKAKVYIYIYIYIYVLINNMIYKYSNINLGVLLRLDHTLYV